MAADLDGAADQEIVRLIDEDGKEREFRLHDAFEVEGAAYYLVEEVQSPEVVLVLREGEAGLEALEGEEFDRVMALLEENEG